MKIINKSFGSYIKEARKQKGWILIEAAQKLGISKSLLSDFENNKVDRIKMDMLKTISINYGLPYDETVIMGGRIPEDVYYKIIRNPELVTLIREINVSEI